MAGIHFFFGLQKKESDLWRITTKATKHMDLPDKVEKKMSWL
jgi:hypothetical protein